jgi:hypothetical protein
VKAHCPHGRPWFAYCAQCPNEMVAVDDIVEGINHMLAREWMSSVTVNALPQGAAALASSRTGRTTEDHARGVTTGDGNDSPTAMVKGS